MSSTLNERWQTNQGDGELLDASFWCLDVSVHEEWR